MFTWPGRSASGDGLSRARSVALAVLSVEFVVLAVTGVALYFVYHPSTSQAWNRFTGTDSGLGGIPHWTRLAHLFTARVTVPTAIVAGILLALRTAAPRRWTGRVLGAAVALTTIVAWYTGFLLPWDQLALWAVTVGSNLDGYGVLFGDAVRFVLIGGVEVPPATIIRWLIVHAAIAGPVLGVLIAVSWRRHLAAPLAGSVKVQA